MSTNVNNQNLKFHFVPSNLSINELNVVLTGERDVRPITHKVLNFYTLIVKKLINNMIFEEGANEWVSINKYERECLLGDSYVTIIEKLVNAGMLLEDPYWEHIDGGKNNRTKLYALPKGMFKADKVFQQVEIPQQKVIQNMIDKFHKLRFKKSGQALWREEMIKTSYRILLHDTSESRHAVQAHLDKISIANPKYIMKLCAADVIEIFNKSVLHQANIDPFGKRVHTKITNMPKTIREFLYFENRPNEKLGCVDIVNSQPVFMSIATPAIIKRFTPELKEAEPIISKYQHHPDVAAFKQKCADGNLYESIMAYFLTKGIQLTRDQAKPIAYIGFFGNYLPFELGKLTDEHKKLAYQFMKEEYNGMYKMFKEMKMGAWSENIGGKMHANNCMLAQRLESQVFYTLIVPAVWDAGYKDFSTIHDCVIAPEKDCAGIKAIIYNEFKKLNISLKLSD